MAATIVAAAHPRIAFFLPHYFVNLQLSRRHLLHGYLCVGGLGNQQRMGARLALGLQQPHRLPLQAQPIPDWRLV
jgi:hypothetical protein